MQSAKVCQTCGGAVDVTIVHRHRADGTFVSYAEGVCRACGRRYEEGELLALEGPPPVGG
jgi:hypothetical protein